MADKVWWQSRTCKESERAQTMCVHDRDAYSSHDKEYQMSWLPAWMYRFPWWCCCPGWIGFFSSHFCLYFCIIYVPKQQTALWARRCFHMCRSCFIYHVKTRKMTSDQPSLFDNLGKILHNAMRKVQNPHSYVGSGHLPQWGVYFLREPSVSPTNASNFWEADPTTQRWPSDGWQKCLKMLSHSLVSVCKLTSNLSTFKFNNSFSFCCWLDFIKKAATLAARLLH